MTSDRKTAITVGILFISCTAATLISFPFSGPVLDDPDYLTRLSENDSLVITGVLIEFIWAATAMGIAIGLYPILKKYNGALSLGSVGFRIIEGIFVLIGTLSLLSLLTLSQKFVSEGLADASSFQAAGALLLGIREWAHNMMVIITFNLGALIYYYLMYQSKIIPRWLSGWGFIGAILSLAATLISSYTQSFGEVSIQDLLNVPIGLNELFLAVWLIIKGFNPSAIASSSAKTVN